MKKKLLMLTLVLSTVAAAGLFSSPARAEDDPVNQDCFVVDDCGNVCCWVGPRLLCSARPCDLEP